MNSLSLCFAFFFSLVNSVPDENVLWRRVVEFPFIRAAAKVSRPPAGGTGGLHGLGVRPLMCHDSASEGCDVWHFEPGLTRTCLRDSTEAKLSELHAEFPEALELHCICWASHICPRRRSMLL